MSKSTDEYKNLSIEETLRELGTDVKSGLTEEEVKKRFSQYGYNEIPEREESLFHRIFRRFWGPIPWMIEVAALLSAAVRRWEDFVIISVLLLTNAFIAR